MEFVITGSVPPSTHLFSLISTLPSEQMSEWLPVCQAVKALLHWHCSCFSPRLFTRSSSSGVKSTWRRPKSATESLRWWTRTMTVRNRNHSRCCACYMLCYMFHKHNMFVFLLCSFMFFKCCIILTLLFHLWEHVKRIYLIFLVENIVYSFSQMERRHIDKFRLFWHQITIYKHSYLYQT